jgi:hypothetical protein
VSYRARFWTALGKRGTGLLADRRGDLDRALRFERLDLIGAPTLSAGRSLEAYCPPAYDQGATGSCVAQALVLAEQVGLSGYYGRKTLRASRLFAYYMGRLRDASGTDEISDHGSRPLSVLYAIADHGLPPESSYPWDLSRLNRQPTASARWDARQRAQWGESYLIHDHGEDRLAAVRRAINSRLPVCLDVYARPLLRYSSGIVPYERGEPDHYVLVIGYREGRDGTELQIQNSWGARWGQSGRAWLSARVAMDARSPIVHLPAGGAQ